MAAIANLTDEQKVAILLASLDENIAASIIQQLEPDVMNQVAVSLRNLGVISGDSKDKALSECIKGIIEMGEVIQGDDRVVNSLLTKAIGEKRATALLQDKTVVTKESFLNIVHYPPDQLAALLAREKHSVVATVLRYLPPEKGAEILGLMPADTRRLAMVFMCKAKPPSADAVARIGEYLEQKLGRVQKASKSEEEGGDKLDRIAGILQNMDKAVEEEILTAIDESSAEIGTKIRDKLFTFEDIVHLSDVAMRRLLQEVDMALLALALRSASINLKEKIFKNMSKRAGEGLREEMEFAQKMKLSEVQEKQREIVNVIRKLEAEGQITTGAEGADQYV